MRASLITHVFSIVAFQDDWRAQGFSINDFFKGSEPYTLSQKPIKAPKRKDLNTPAPSPKSPQQSFSIPTLDLELPDILDIPNPISPSAWNKATSAALSFATKFAPREVKEASDKSARITVNRLPPQSFKVDLTDVPIVGKALSGTYAKVKDGKVSPSVVIASPRDKVGAMEGAIDTGKFQFGVSGLLSTVLDIQLEPNQAGVAPVEIKSSLIPKWPFGERKSEWNKVINMGDGAVYYFNSKTQETRLEPPKHKY
jgi:hypothetical protein